MASFRGRHFVAKGHLFLMRIGWFFINSIGCSDKDLSVSEASAIQEKSGTGREEDTGGGRNGTGCRRLLPV